MKTRTVIGHRSGEIARRADVSTDTLRHYERKGLLGKPRRLENGYRAYPPEALDRVLTIQRALAVGFTLDELATLLRARDRGRYPCRDVRALAERKLQDVERQLEDLARFRDALEQLLRDWDGRLAKRKGDGPVRLSGIARLEAAIWIVSSARARLRPLEKTKGAEVRKPVPAILITFLIGGSAVLAQTAGAPSCHHADVDERGDHVMGFDHTKTSHHFLLSKSGGSIEASANDPADIASRDAIRGHFTHIAAMFSEGNFEAPMLIHDRIPPGVPTMKNKKALIEWKFEETPAGGRVRITTRDAEALAAIHEFLRFQIEDHRTGDPTGVPAEPGRRN